MESSWVGLVYVEESWESLLASLLSALFEQWKISSLQNGKESSSECDCADTLILASRIVRNKFPSFSKPPSLYFCYSSLRWIHIEMAILSSLVSKKAGKFLKYFILISIKNNKIKHFDTEFVKLQLSEKCCCPHWLFFWLG